MAYQPLMVRDVWEINKWAYDISLRSLVRVDKKQSSSWKIAIRLSINVLPMVIYCTLSRVFVQIINPFLHAGYWLTGR